MNVLPAPHFLEPISFGQDDRALVMGGGGSPEIWHIQLEQQQPAPVRQKSRESSPKISQLESTIHFMHKQHNEVLQSLHNEIENLKIKNRGKTLFNFSATYSSSFTLLVSRFAV